MPKLSESYVYLTCPFCEKDCIEAKPGNVCCPMCFAEFEIDDRSECVFGDTENIRLPATGTICASCGLIQAGHNQNCLYCGMLIGTTVQ